MPDTKLIWQRLQLFDANIKLSDGFSYIPSKYDAPNSAPAKKKTIILYPPFFHLVFTDADKDENAIQLILKATW